MENKKIKTYARCGVVVNPLDRSSDTLVSIEVASRDIDKIEFPAGTTRFCFYDKEVRQPIIFFGQEIDFESKAKDAKDERLNESQTFYIGEFVPPTISGASKGSVVDEYGFTKTIHSWEKFDVVSPDLIKYKEPDSVQ